MLAPSCAVRRDASCAGAEANFSTVKAMQLDLAGDLHVLFRDIVDIRSESLHEEELADAVEAALRQFDHLKSPESATRSSRRRISVGILGSSLLATSIPCRCQTTFPAMSKPVMTATTLSVGEPAT